MAPLRGGGTTFIEGQEEPKPIQIKWHGLRTAKTKVGLKDSDTVLLCVACNRIIDHRESTMPVKHTVSATHKEAVQRHEADKRHSADHCSSNDQNMQRGPDFADDLSYVF
eukprot:TRINITY_DN2163_c0_g1_i6.p1 TRINITY_DN2163_c0_g1~~TRINITY_DN2163_c0_g1_i6.p1  ORF type:complete len:110 (-),score=2.56 TRINITY_DN2163_c0_g1_i6:779-1108(-)